MPLYEYQCLQCEQVFEMMQKFSDDPVTQCPQCSGSVKKLISKTSFSLKGSGWYVSDYKRAPQAATPPASPGSPSPVTPGSGAAAAATPASSSSGSTSEPKTQGASPAAASAAQSK